jgi:hypothetical protein
LERKPVRSSNVRAVGYDSGTLEVEFSDGSVYRYQDVPEKVHKGLMRASSIGSYLAMNIKGKYKHKVINA